MTKDGYPGGNARVVLAAAAAAPATRTRTQIATATGMKGTQVKAPTRY